MASFHNRGPGRDAQAMHISVYGRLFECVLERAEGVHRLHGVRFSSQLLDCRRVNTQKRVVRSLLLQSGGLSALVRVVLCQSPEADTHATNTEPELMSNATEGNLTICAWLVRLRSAALHALQT